MAVHFFLKCQSKQSNRDGISMGLEPRLLLACCSIMAASAPDLLPPPAERGGEGKGAFSLPLRIQARSCVLYSCMLVNIPVARRPSCVYPVVQEAQLKILLPQKQGRADSSFCHSPNLKGLFWQDFPFFPQLSSTWWGETPVLPELQPHFWNPKSLAIPNSRSHKLKNCWQRLCLEWWASWIYYWYFFNTCFKTSVGITL